MDFMTVKQASEKWNTHIRVIQELCKNGRIEGASRVGRDWLIPKDAKKPADMRYKINKQSSTETDPDAAGINWNNVRILVADDDTDTY